MPKLNKKIKPYRHTTQYYRVVKKQLKHNDCVVHTLPIKIEANANSAASDNITSSNVSYDNTVIDSDEFSYTELDEIDKQVNEELDNQLLLLDSLRLWALSHKVTITATNDLLKILRAHGRSELPKDGRTLLKTPSSVEIYEMGSGKFWYHGITNNLVNALCNIGDLPQTVSLIINIDGMSPFNSSNHQFWPICFLIDELRQIKPMVAAIFYGESKPPLSLYFREFIKELKCVLKHGLHVNGQNIVVKIKCFVCDTQARSFIKGTPACNSENGSCIKCTVVGEWDRKGRHMSYPRIHCPRRTDQSFRNKIDDDHHKEHTPLTELPIDMVEEFIVADSLHLLDLGVMRRCLYGWREGSYNFRTKLSRIQADLMSEMLENCNSTRPLDIQRAIRNLKTLKFWKGSEYRVFLLYLGVVVLKDFLTYEVYEHFLMLSCAVTIISCKEYLKYINIAEQLLEDYIERFIEIYGIDSISSNIHNLCHIIDDVKKFGHLPLISSYPFENHLGHLKAMVRHGNLPLSQISKRIIETSKLEIPNPNRGIYVINELQKHHSQPMCKGVYKQLHITDDFILCADNKNQYFMTKDGDIVFMSNVTYFNNQIHVFGEKLSNKYDFFVKPFASSKLNIFATKATPQEQLRQTAVKYIFQTDPPKLYSLNEIKCKLFRVQYHNEFVFFPLLHTLDIASSNL